MSEDIKRKLLFVVLIFLLIVLISLAYLIYGQIGEARKIAATRLGSPTATASAQDNISVSFDLGSPAASEVLDDVKDTANRFMDAKLQRSLETAKPYMSDKLYKSTNQDEFAGTSSPSMDRFQVTSAEAVKTPDTFKVKVTSYWKLNGEDADQIRYELIVIKADDKFLVDEFEQAL
jgi:hypothetical protein